MEIQKVENETLSVTDLTPFENLINEETAKYAHMMNSFRSYETNETTNGYMCDVRKAFSVASRVGEENPNYGKDAIILASKYAHLLANYINKSNSIRSRCPSILISGGSNFAVKKKEKQNQAMDRLYRVDYPALVKILNNLKALLKKAPKKETQVVPGFDLESFDIKKCPLFSIEQNIEDNRLKLFFDEKPIHEIREVLKKRGFKYAPSTGAWQRQLTRNAIITLKEVTNWINSLTV